MARFLGIFTGSIMILTLFGKLLLFSYLLRNYGLKVCLTISPVLLAVFTAIAIAFGHVDGLHHGNSQRIYDILYSSRTYTGSCPKSMDDSIESPLIQAALSDN